eukprot:10125737-Lingulodinium_polyedra.AAC.1
MRSSAFAMSSASHKQLEQRVPVGLALDGDGLAVARCDGLADAGCVPLGGHPLGGIAASGRFGGC